MASSSHLKMSMKTPLFAPVRCLTIAALALLCFTAVPSIAAATPLVWFKADAIPGLSNNDPVSTWTDSSGNGRDATQSGTLRPSYITGALSGLPVVRFDGTSNFMNIADDPVWAFSSFDMLAVLKITATSPAWWSRAWLGQDEGGGSSNNKWIWSYDPSAGTQVWHIYNAFAANTVVDGGPFSPSGSQFYVLELSRNGANYSFFTDGLLNGTAIDATPIPNVAANLTLGMAEGGTFQGDIAEVLIYGSSLSSGERASTTDYLGAKYAIVVPEPSVSALLLVGTAALVRGRRKRAA